MAVLCAASVFAQTQDPTLEYVMQLKVKLTDAFGVGNTPGGQRYAVPIEGGTFEGPRLKGTVLNGGADYQLHRPELQRTEVEAIYNIRTDDGVNIHVHNAGLITPDKEKPYFYTSPKFEAPVDSRYAWLNDGIFVCRPAGGAADEIWLDVWKVTDAKDFDASIGDIRPIPDHIYLPAEKQGKIETFTYTATRGSEKISKKARVYVPFGYNPKDKKRKYNVLYLIHGGGDNTLSFLAPPSDWLPLKNVLDHLIAEGKMDPILVVTPTFYEDDENIKHSGMMDAVKKTEDFHSEFHNDLIPAVEKAYNTFLSGTDSESISASRQHRAFGGFSMGALTTWYQLAYGNEDVKYYLPLSGDCWVYDAAGNKKSAEYAADWLNEMVGKSRYKDDFQILGYSGTKDIAGNPQRDLVRALDAHAPLFRYEPGGALDSIDWNRNLRFAMKTDGEHYYGDINRYLYYALPLLFQK